MEAEGGRVDKRWGRDAWRRTEVGGRWRAVGGKRGEEVMVFGRVRRRDEGKGRRRVSRRRETDEGGRKFAARESGVG